MKKTEESIKNNITELVFILDRSGSMEGLEKDTIGGFNSILAEQKNKDGKCFVTTVLFDHELLTLHDRLDFDKVEKLTEKDYQVRGSTALIDAIGSTIKHIASIHKYARKSDVPQKTMFVIITDGYENSSHIYSSGEVKKMIERKKEKDGWEFLFIGANIDAVETAAHFGINEDRAVNYHADGCGTKVVYESISEQVGNLRCAKPLSGNWNAKIKKDFKSRK
ncbi:MAG: VWA domain-containing protein [Eubacterium sp.]|nr:VWA domain-containing protein [Eubacterium sp.]